MVSLHVCMYVYMFSGRSTAYNVTVCRSISMRFPLLLCRKEQVFQLSVRFQLSDGATIFDGMGENFEKFQKLTEKFVYTTSTI